MDDLGRIQPVPGAENGYGLFIEVRPWPRFFARLLDYSIFTAIVFILADKAFKIELSFLPSIFLYFAALFMWSFFEALLLSTLCTTPGKWLLNVTVRNKAGGRLTFTKALQRSLLAWLCGIWMGIPVFFVLGFVFSYCRLITEKTVVWDEKSGCSVSHGYGQMPKTIAVFALFAGFTYFFILKPTFEFAEKNAKILYDTYSTNLPTGSFINSALDFNRQGFDLINRGMNEEAMDILLAGLDKNPSDYVKDSIYNNLCLACYNLGKYSEALDYIEKGLNIQENSCEEYLNYGNVLLALGRTREAENAYSQSIDIDDTRYNSSAVYGLGTIKYDDGDYPEAIKLFEKYTEFRKDDPVGWCYLGLSYLYGEKDMSKARGNLEKALSINPTDDTAINSMVQYYDYINDSGKSEKLYADALAKSPGNYDLLCGAAEYYNKKGDYEKGLEYTDRAISADKGGHDAYRVKAQAYLWDGQEDKAVEAANDMIINSPDIVNAYIIAGDLFFNSYNHKLAGEFYDGALAEDPSNVTACVGKIGSLYYRKRYTQCLEYALESEKIVEDTDVLWYIADVYSKLQNSQKAIEYYKKALETDKDNIDLNISLGWEYYYSEKYSDAAAYTDKVSKPDSSDYGAKGLREAIEKRQRNLPEQVGEFIENNYMYYKPNEEFDRLKNNLISRGSASGKELSALFETVHLKDDIFSFVLYGDIYRRYEEAGNEVTTEYIKYGDNIHYVRITNFTETTSNEFLDIVDNIADPTNQYLVIDLRGNGGGITDSGCRILDFLLPDCAICNLIYKDGYSDSYYSDDESIQFRRIFLFVDENTASCAELVTLGLKTYLDDVTVIGRKTFGKGVGQAVFIDKARELAVYAVNHYWNVRETNIMEKGIEPDINVNGNTNQAFMDEVYRFINN